MKKILLGTTGLVGAALFAAAASAETPKVTLGGFSNFQAGWTSNDADEVETDDDRSMAFRNDNEISIHVDGKSDAGLAYGVVVDLEADISGDNDTQHDEDDSDSPLLGNSARTFTYLEGGWGRVELGGNKSAAATMRVDASTVAVATGGINGDWRHFVQPNGTTQNAGDENYITTSKLQMEHGGVDYTGDESTYNITKATYYTPRFSGFQGGVSFSPDVQNVGQVAQRIDDQDEDGYGEIWEAALGYEGQFSGVKVAASATGNWADADVTGDDDIEGWNFGALLGWNAFSLAGSYGNWGEGAFEVSSVSGSNTLIDDALVDVDGSYWTVGLAYDAGAVGLSATYIDSELEEGAVENEFDNLVLGADYKLAPGLTTYAEVAFYDYDSEDVDDNNDGTTVLIGTQVAY